MIDHAESGGCRRQAHHVTTGFLRRSGALQESSRLDSSIIDGIVTFPLKQHFCLSLLELPAHRDGSQVGGGGLMRLCAALDNLNRSRLIFSREPLDGSNFISRPQRIEGLRVHAGEEVTPQRPRPLVGAGASSTKGRPQKRLFFSGY